MNSRNNTITHIKALGIILMVMGHSQCSIPHVWELLTMFHMPLFFFVSGYCLKPRYLDTPKEFLLGRIRRLYLPFVKWSVILTLLHNFFLRIHIYDANYGWNGVGTEPKSWSDMLETISLIVFQMRCSGLLLGGYWFLNALFFGSIMAWVLLRYVRNPTLALLAGILTFLVAHATNFHIVFLNINTRAFAAALLIVTGYWMAQTNKRPFNMLETAGAFVLTIIGTRHWLVCINDTSYKGFEIIPYILTSVLATWGCYSLFCRWKETSSMASRLMIFIGNNTLYILTWHLLCFKVTSYLIVRHYDLPIKRLAEYPVMAEYANPWWLAYTAISLIMCLLIALMGNNLSAYINSKREALTRQRNRPYEKE